jgi:hypothetical protein
MDLPIQFPSDTDVILEDVARFRALSQEDQLRAYRSLLSSGVRILRVSPKADWARRYAEEQEVLAQRNIQEFIARHEH